MSVIQYLQEYLKESTEQVDDIDIPAKDLKVANTIYRYDDIDKDEYEYMSKVVEKARLDISKTEELLKSRFIDKDTKGITQSLKANKLLVHNWDTKIKSWMEKVLKEKGI
jgi:hypothetical protein